MSLRAAAASTTVAVVLGVTFGCGSTADDPEAGQPTPRVVVSGEMLAAIATAALGDDAVVEIEPGSDLIDQTVLAQLAPIPFGEGPQWAKPPRPSDTTPPVGAPDPSFWLDPDRVTQAARLVVDTVPLSEAARQRTDGRLETIADTMRAADEQVQAITGEGSPDQRVAATDSVRLGYFAERYGFLIAPADGDDPLAGLDLDRLGPSGSPTATLDGLIVEVARRLTAP